MSTHRVETVGARDPEVNALLGALTLELAGEGYASEETFGYSVEQLEAQAVHLVGVRAGGVLVGVGGIELQADRVAELKRFYVVQSHRGRGVADAILSALLSYAAEQGVVGVRLETGDKQLSAIAFYRRHGFAEVPRFAPYTGSATSVCMQRDLGGSADPQS